MPRRFGDAAGGSTGCRAIDSFPDASAGCVAERILIIASRTLNRQTEAVEQVRHALGSRHAATFDDCIEHTPRASVIAAADLARETNPDPLVTIGGGTAIDTAKVMQIAVAHRLTRPELLGQWHLRSNPDGSRHVPPVEPAITRHTPPWLWLSTGVRGLDHAVEGICSIQYSPLIKATCLQALRLFAKALPRSRADPDDLGARLQCQQAAWLAGLGILRVPHGASHGIGHSLGAVTGMSHGYTSCIMLPHVMRFNRLRTADRQHRIATVLGGDTASDAADRMAALIESLGMPTRLRNCQVEVSQHQRIAQGAMENLWLKTNPEPITRVEQVMDLLQAAQ